MDCKNISMEFLRHIFSYNDGKIYWKNKPSKSFPIVMGKEAGYIHHSNYRYLKIFQKSYLAHRIIFMFHKGYMPKIVDHIDKNTLNNKIENLREATNSENCLNQKLRKTNKSGCKNVSWSSRLKKWFVKLNVNKKTMFIGAFDDLELADLVAIEARNKFHFNFASHK